jgi:hypothetical protein
MCERMLFLKSLTEISFLRHHSLEFSLWKSFNFFNRHWVYQSICFTLIFFVSCFSLETSW